MNVEKALLDVVAEEEAQKKNKMRTTGFSVFRLFAQTMCFFQGHAWTRKNEYGAFGFPLWLCLQCGRETEGYSPESLGKIND